MAAATERLHGFVRKHWRATGFVVLLLVGTIVVTNVIDRGHDPLWRAQGHEIFPHDAVAAFEVAQVAMSPDGERAYAVLTQRIDMNHRLAGVAAFSKTGERVWLHEATGRADRLVTAVAAGGFAYATALATDEDARLVVLSPEGAVAYEESLNASVRALAFDGNDLAVALQAPGNPVRILQGGVVLREHSFESFVDALDLRGELLAVATGVPGGSTSIVTAFRGEDTILQEYLDRRVRSLGITSDAGAVVAAGGEPLAGGFVATWDVSRPGAGVRVMAFDGFGYAVSFLDIGGVAALALEDAPGQGVLHYWSDVTKAGSWAPDWRWQSNGLVTRDPASRTASARIAPDGSGVAVATTTGDLVLLDAASKGIRWTYSMAGATSIAFAADEPRSLLTNGRALASQPSMDEIRLFDVEEEPFLRDKTRILPALLAVEIVFGAALLGGLWSTSRDRRAR